MIDNIWYYSWSGKAIGRIRKVYEAYLLTIKNVAIGYREKYLINMLISIRYCMVTAWLLTPYHLQLHASVTHSLRRAHLITHIFFDSVLTTNAKITDRLLKWCIIKIDKTS